MKKMELNNEELSQVAGGDYWTDKGYQYYDKSQYFKTNEEAMKYAKEHAEEIRKKAGVNSLAYMVQSDKDGFYLNYYKK